MALYRADPSRVPLLTEENSLVTFDEEDIKRSVIRKNKKSRRQFVCYVVFSVILMLMFGAALYLLSGNLSEDDDYKKHDFPPSKSILGKYKQAAIASDNEVCSQVGKKILEEKKGSSIDATIGKYICWDMWNKTDPHSSGIGAGFFDFMTMTGNKTDPHSSWIGGGFFMTIYDRSHSSGIGGGILLNKTDPMIGGGTVKYVICGIKQDPHSSGIGGGFFMTILQVNICYMWNKTDPHSSWIGAGFFYDPFMTGKYMLCGIKQIPHSSGIGGGFFMTIYDSKKKTSVVLDAREAAPLNAREDMYEKDPEQSVLGGLAIAVPGEVRGYQKLCEMYKCLPWKDLVQPSIDLAKKGFKITANTGRAIESSKDKIIANPAFKKAYTNPATKELYKVGEIARFPSLANTLRTIAEEGPQTFYNGNLSKNILEDLKEADSIIQERDLQSYTVLQKEAVKSVLNDGSTLYSAPAPSGGPVWLFIMNIMDGYNITPESVLPEKSELLTYHRLVEAFKFAYAKRTDLGDPDFVPNVTAVVKNLTSRSYADGIRQKIWDNQTHDYMYYGPTFYDKLKTSTAHLSMVGNDGLAIAVTTTVNTVFASGILGSRTGIVFFPVLFQICIRFASGILGSRTGIVFFPVLFQICIRFASGILGSRTGIIFNNEMDDFSSPNITNDFGIRPSPANFIRPGKRPLSSMSPSVVAGKDGGIKLVIGAAGGSHITTSVSYITMRVLWFKETIKQAIDAARIHHQLLPPYIYYESEFPKHFVEGLRNLGHNITDKPAFRTDANGVTTKNGLLYANCDFRRGGAPDGF
ncbi:GGT1_5 [Mytilus coruscus]|uniref:GGT1_5 n=1 Tax=Mytilus coruscus TaxID=42192 RepID=A0A6J8C5T9_MYTCO|nr:GGT1_5 [Mytilus coruscus]